MEAIRVKLSTKCNGSELYCSTENSFAVIAGRLARIDRTRQRETQRQAEKDRDRYREGQRQIQRGRVDVGRQYSFAVISSTKAILSLSFFPSLLLFYPVLSFVYKTTRPI